MKNDPSQSLSANRLALKRYTSPNSRPLLTLAGLWIILCAVQAALTFSVSATYSMAVCIISATLSISYVFSGNRLVLHPLSSLSIVGYVLYYFILPPIATAAEFKALTNNLESPNAVFSHAAVGLVTVLTAHYFYTKSKGAQRTRQLITEKLLYRTGYFSADDPLHLYLIGLVGIVGTAQQAFSAGAIHVSEADRSALDKAIQGLFPLAYVPYSIVVPQLLRRATTFSRTAVIWLVPYSGLVLIVGAARNSRAAVFLGVASIFLAFLYSRTVYPSSRKTGPLKKLAVLVGLLLVTGPLADLATSMVAVRADRSDIPASELLSATVSAYQNKALLDAFREDSVKAPDPLWDETYVDNLFAARLCNPKFLDLALTNGSVLNGSQREELLELEVASSFTILPRPVIDFFALEIDKDFLASGSGGDRLLMVATGSPYAMGTFRTGSLIGGSFAIFGWAYPLVLFAGAFLAFIILDVGVLRHDSIGYDNGTGRFGVFWSPLSVTTLFTTVFFYTSAATGMESLSGLVQFMLRSWPQAAIIYILVFWFTLPVIRMLRS